MSNDKEERMTINKKAYTWNTINSILNAGMSAILLLAVSRVCGEDDAGQFTIAFSIAQLMVTIGYFELRSFQVTDVEHKYSDNEYYSFKILSCILMIVVSIGYVFIKNYSMDKSILILLLCLLKMIDAYEEYFVSVYQANDKLAIGAKLSSYRMIITITTFFIATIITKNMCITVIITIMVSVGYLYFFIIRRGKRDFLIRVNKLISPSIKRLFIECFPLFFGAYLTLYIGNAPKYAIDECMDSRFQTYYGILYMPSFVINLLSGFIFKPLLVDMSVAYYNNRAKYRRIIMKILGFLTAISIVMIVGGYFIGTPILGLVYGVDINDYSIELAIILLGGAISALGVVICYMLTIMRSQKWMMISYVITAIAAFTLSPAFVSNYGIMGASVAFLSFNLLRVIVFIIVLVICNKRKKVIEN